MCRNRFKPFSTYFILLFSIDCDNGIENYENKDYTCVLCVYSQCCTNILVRSKSGFFSCRPPATCYCMVCVCQFFSMLLHPVLFQSILFYMHKGSHVYKQ